MAELAGRLRGPEGRQVGGYRAVRAGGLAAEGGHQIEKAEMIEEG